MHFSPRKGHTYSNHYLPHQKSGSHFTTQMSSPRNGFSHILKILVISLFTAFTPSITDMTEDLFYYQNVIEHMELCTIVVERSPQVLYRFLY